ncbi:hypothetical protein A9974_18115 [Achromobacter sp. UMC71]|nr:hypothetical protein [Achromobacter sp. UMC71]
MHVHAQTIGQAAVLARSIADQAQVALYVETEAQLRAGFSLHGRHYLLVQGHAEWLDRLFTVPCSPYLSGVIVLLEPGAGTPPRLAGIDRCLPSSASPDDIMAVVKALTPSPLTD